MHPPARQPHDDDVNELTPMLTSLDERRDQKRYFVFPHKRSSLTSANRTQIQAQVHATPAAGGYPQNSLAPRNQYSGESPRRSSLVHWRPLRESAYPPHMSQASGNTLTVNEPLSRQARSFDAPRSFRGEAGCWQNSRKVFSYEEDFVQQRGRKRLQLQQQRQDMEEQLSPQLEHDRLHITEFVKLPLNTPHYLHNSGSLTSHIRYNDPGSFDDLSDEIIDGIVEDHCLSRQESGERRITVDSKYLWQLRSTFEEEDELSDSLHMNDSPSSDADDVSAPEVAEQVRGNSSIVDGVAQPGAAQAPASVYDLQVTKQMTSRLTMHMTSHNQLMTSSTHGGTQLHPSQSTCHYSTPRRDNFRSMLQRRNDGRVAVMTSAMQRRQQMNGLPN